ncbi:MAG: hypothetical protein GIW99_08200 [Candidatus Eremiobacteraeota bacterium]|nr:hypothetical protein [Candidatus Eremiobacteraeota bacterium]MBC5827644.1 hypothetical protein [Candidatus Eremiobacteraeota bacterium]
MKKSFAICAALSLLAVAGCSSNKPAADNAPVHRTEATVERNALPLNQMAAMPHNLRCRRSDTVWVNMNTRTIHEPGDPFYGRTKHGGYMCMEDARAGGYHLAGASHGRGSGYGERGMQSQEQGYGTRRHRRRSEPMPVETPTN